MTERRPPLIDRLVNFRAGESVGAVSSLKGVIMAETGPSASLCLELLSEAASVLFAHRRLTRAYRAVFAQSVSLNPNHPLDCLARRVSMGVEVTLQQSRDSDVPVIIASALLELADSAPESPVGQLDEWVLERRGRAPNGEALYRVSEAQLDSRADTAEVVQWAASAGLGQMLALIGLRGDHFGGLPPSLPLVTNPGVVDGLCQLAAWQWYALAGQTSRVRDVERIEWYRTSRADEELIGSVICRGSRDGCPLFDAIAYDGERKRVVELKGLRLLNVQTRPHEVLPRAEWQHFVRVLGASSAPRVSP